MQQEIGAEAAAAAAEALDEDGEGDDADSDNVPAKRRNTIRLNFANDIASGLYSFAVWVKIPGKAPSQNWWNLRSGMHLVAGLEAPAAI